MSGQGKVTCLQQDNLNENVKPINKLHPDRMTANITTTLPTSLIFRARLFYQSLIELVSYNI